MWLFFKGMVRLRPRSGMRSKNAIARRFAGPILVAALEVFAASAMLAATSPALAQWGFGGFFGQPTQRRQQNPYGWPWQQEPRREAPVDSSRAPPAHKRETPATTNVLVLGDSMADWLGYGLEDAFSETPEIGVIRKPRPNRGLIKTEGRDPYDVVAALREMLGGEKPDYIVMMTGLADRTSIRERPRPAQPTPDAGREDIPAAGPPAAAVGPARRTESAAPCGRGCRSRDRRAGDHRARARGGAGPVRHGDPSVPFGQMGGALRQAHRRDDRGAQVEGRTGAVGRTPRDPWDPRDRRHGLSQRPLPRPRRQGRHRLRRHLGRVRRRERQLRQPGARFRRPDSPAAPGRWRALHQGRRAQARALRRTRN